MSARTTRTFRPALPAAVLGALATGLLLFAPAASASDTFSINNESKVASLTGTSLWGKGNTMSSKCRTGPFPGPTLTSFTFNPGDTGSISLSQDPFSKCLAGVNPLTDNPVTSPFLTGAVWNWIPVDPEFGSAHLTCYDDEGFGTQALESRVDGLTCTFYDPSPQASGAFSSSAAPVRGGSAVALVKHTPGSATPADSSSGRYELLLRHSKGGADGRKRATIVAGSVRKVRIPISRSLRKRVAKKGFVKVKATLKRVDGQPGTGHRTTLIVMKDHRSLPF